MKHPFDPRINAGHEQAVWHADPLLRDLVHILIGELAPDVWVETGSHCGWTSHWLATKYPELPIETVELDDRYAAIAAENLAEFPNVRCFLGSSDEFLRRQRDRYATLLPCFWLDAHWWLNVPLQRECAIVATLPRYICLIDDFECKNPDFPGDGGEETFGYRMNNLAYVAEFLGKRCWRPNYECPPGGKGYGVFIKGAEFTFPEWMKEDVLP